VRLLGTIVMRRLLLCLLLRDPSPAHSLSLAARFFDWFKASEAVAAVHRKHVEGDTVQHMLKSTPFASAPDELKLDFARGPAGAIVAEFMRAEQRYIGDWKLDKIVEAAGADFNPSAARATLAAEASSAPVVLFSFVDCPWCLLAKATLRDVVPEDALKVIELEDLGTQGKQLRGAIALATGRTSMPAIFVGGRGIGGFTDGEPAGDEKLCVAGSPGLEKLVQRGEFGELLRVALESSAAAPFI